MRLYGLLGGGGGGGGGGASMYPHAKHGATRGSGGVLPREI